MPINVRRASVNISVICFFSLSIVTLLSGLSPFICCKRAIIGSVVVYIAANIGIRLINMILIDAMVTNQLEQLSSSENPPKRKERQGR